MQLPANVQLFIDLHKQNKGRSREWPGPSCAELCPGLSEQAQLGPGQAGGAAALAAFGW